MWVRADQRTSIRLTYQWTFLFSIQRINTTHSMCITIWNTRSLSRGVTIVGGESTFPLLLPYQYARIYFAFGPNTELQQLPSTQGEPFPHSVPLITELEVEKFENKGLLTMLECRPLASAKIESFSALVALTPTWAIMWSNPISRTGKGADTLKFCCSTVAENTSWMCSRIAGSIKYRTPSIILRIY